MAPINIASFVNRVRGLLTPSQSAAQTPRGPASPAALVAPAPTASTPPTPGRELEPQAPISRREQLLMKCHALGKEFARTTKTLKPDGSLLKALEEHVVSMAIAESLPPFDPNANDFDRRVETKLSNLDGRVEQREDQIEMAAAERRRRQDERAKLGDLKPRPAATPLLRWSAAIGITFSLAPAIHDFVNGMFPLLKWLVAIGFAGAFALFIVTATLPDDQRLD